MSGSVQGTDGIKMSDVLNQAISAYMSDVHTSIPARVESYDSSTKKVSVKPLIRKIYKNGEKISLPVIGQVPVLFVGTNNTVFQFELTRGDTGLLIFTERALEYWLSGNGSEKDPGDPRKFSLTDGVFLPGLFTFSNPGKVGSGSGLEILNKQSSLILTDVDIEINGNTKNFVTHAELNTALQDMVTAINVELEKIKVAIAGVGGSYVPIPITLDISASKTNKVKTG